MSAEEITGPARQYVIEHVGSVAELEVLLLVRGDPSREWTAAAVAQELRIEPDWTARRLDALRAQRILARSETAPPRYRYAPATPEQDHTVAELARCYNERRVSVITLIYSKPRDHIRSFANAFRIRDDK